MTTQPPESAPQQQVEQLEQEARQRQPGLVSEFVEFLLHEKKWWLIPVVIVLLLLGLLVVLGSTGAAPFIYTVF